MARGLKVAEGALGLSLALKRRMQELPGMKPTALARKAGCSKETVHRILSGYGNPSLSTIENLSKALDTKAWVLIHEEL